jgi:glycosyltransferase involved in cell wall biosynthesis
LRGLGHEVAVAAPGVEDSSQSGGSPGWAGRLKRALPRPLYEIMELAYSVIAYRRLKQAIRAFQPTGIYERYNLFLVAGVWARARFGLPLVLEVNGPVALERRIYGGLSLAWLADWVEHYVWRHADVVLPVTQVLAEHIIAQGVPRERVVVVPNGVNVADYSAIPHTDEAKIRLGLGGCLVIGFTGFVREWDRLDRIVRWLAAYSGPERTHLLVVGDGPARAEIEACAAACGVSDRVTLTGVIRRDEVPAAAAAFDIALQTALVPYASPLCLFEYMALGKAIVAPDQPNHREVLRGGIDSLLYDPDDPAGIEKALDELCLDPILRRRIAAAAPATIAERSLTWGDHAERVANLFSRLERERAYKQPAPAQA